MRQNPTSKRGRGRSGGRRPYSNSANRSYDSNGPDVKIRGTANHIFDKYQTLARDASASGDRVASENYLQHAEHYFRIVSANNANQNNSATQGQSSTDEVNGRNRGNGQRPIEPTIEAEAIATSGDGPTVFPPPDGAVELKDDAKTNEGENTATPVIERGGEEASEAAPSGENGDASEKNVGKKKASAKKGSDTAPTN